MISFLQLKNVRLVYSWMGLKLESKSTVWSSVHSAYWRVDVSSISRSTHELRRRDLFQKMKFLSCMSFKPVFLILFVLQYSLPNFWKRRIFSSYVRQFITWNDDFKDISGYLKDLKKKTMREIFIQFRGSSSNCCIFEDCLSVFSKDS